MMYTFQGGKIHILILESRIHITSFDLDNYGSLKGPQLDIKLLHYTTALFLQI